MKNNLDKNTSMDDLRMLVEKFVKNRNWKSYHDPKSLAIAISVESAELLENFLFQSDNFVPKDLESITDEMADIFIYLMSLANSLNLDSFSEKIYTKMEKNRKKYPIDKFSGSNYKKQ